VSDSTVARSNQFHLTGNQQTDFEPQADGSSNRLQASQNQTPHHHLNLRDALDWLLGGVHHDEEELSQDDKTARRHRRMDLLMWLLNLEPRLAPYGE
jgi:hypothetical protein